MIGTVAQVVWRPAFVLPFREFRVELVQVSFYCWIVVKVNGRDIAVAIVGVNQVPPACLRVIPADVSAPQYRLDDFGRSKVSVDQRLPRGVVN